ncbi:phosphatidylglycerophosphatase A [Minwuia thermotolerans]|jgi:phosphatidylglycerophosphatase A|uniref:Phosphatidylglycerophosphatase A n=1 Tax=Minwuia thermotolerans TaxID=2056226 RepID=A0A2M9G6W8_9PROT|nr:phosphatidylglycerophosphatase A [Minwuia thermotolerans]ANK81039.1 MAG: hypothetical protein TEF_09705 [Rhizobiales bacterium NRL2]PJK31416.1 phosphatidylglycerophosphatase A [Minwuia thermotolerans]
MIDRFATMVATFFWVGNARWAPGTMGSIAAAPVGWAMLEFGGKPALLTGVLIASLLGWWAASRHMRVRDRRDDPQEIVIDEAAGLWIGYLALPDAGWAGCLAGLVLFRVIDIWKPGPIGWADRRLKGSLGVMVDDLMAGMLAALLLGGGYWMMEQWA